MKPQVDPHGADTRYYFQYGTADCRATPSACTDLPAPPGEDIGSGFGAQAVSLRPKGLTPGTTLLLPRRRGQQRRRSAKARRRLRRSRRLPSTADVLADGRAWELVSPPEKHGALIYPIGGTTENGGPASGVIEAAQDGSAVTYAANAPIGEEVLGNRALEATQVISTRGPTGWSTQDIVTPSDEALRGSSRARAQEYRWFSPDLSLGLAQPFGPLPADRHPSAGTTAGAGRAKRRTRSVRAPRLDLQGRRPRAATSRSSRPKPTRRKRSSAANWNSTAPRPICAT